MIPSFGEALRFWFQLGWLSFGGPAGQISLMHKTLVEEKKWISEDKFSHALSYCMILPGPEAQQLATYLGWILHGVKGGILAGLLFVLPAVLIFTLISIFYFSYGNVPYVISFLNGVKPAILAVILLAFGNLVLKSLKSNGQILCFALSAIGILFFEISYPYLLLASVLFGWTVFLFGKKNSDMDTNSDFAETSSSKTANLKYQITTSKSETTEAETSERIDLQTSFDEEREKNSELLKNLGRTGSIGLILWATPFLGILFFLKAEFLFWKDLILFFTKTAFLTFGGAYAILPSVAEFATQQAGWISSNEMLDALAFGESTPGPLVMVLTFIGFLAGAHRFGGIGSGLLGLLLTTYYTFLPSFILILGGASLVEKTKESEWIRVCFSYVTACVCAVILYLSVFFAKSILIFPQTSATSWVQNPIATTQWLPLFWTILCVALLKFKKEYSIILIFLSGLFFLGIETLFHL
ncbi:chromate transporter [Leptospira barantonii]|uniref:Chromate transporter n=1 Tax=Leptospira barantonii TaxID=2023184 RepID=A0ABX4NKA6_9LEPT|nr:chromate transporter [Leptospira barantonii]PJZ57256.1 chromate transporter [Leptospira barantonii]